MILPAKKASDLFLFNSININGVYACADIKNIFKYQEKENAIHFLLLHIFMLYDLSWDLTTLRNGTQI